MTTLKEFLKTDRFATCTGVELLEIKPGYARARMEVTDRHLNGGGYAKGELCLHWQIWLLPLWRTAVRSLHFP